MNDPTALDYWTLAIALLGAITGLGALAAQVWSVALSGPRIKVSVANALPTADVRWVLSVDASNVGRLPVTLVDYGIAFRHGREWKRAPIAAMDSRRWQGPQGPYRLSDGDSVTWLVDPAWIAETLREHDKRDVHGYMA